MYQKVRILAQKRYLPTFVQSKIFSLNTIFQQVSIPKVSKSQYHFLASAYTILQQVLLPFFNKSKILGLFGPTFIAWRQSLQDSHHQS